MAPKILSTPINILILYQNNFWNIFIKPRAASELFVFLKNFYKSEFPAENAKKHHDASCGDVLNKKLEWNWIEIKIERYFL